VIEPIVQFLRQESRLQLQARASFDKGSAVDAHRSRSSGAQEAFKICGIPGAGAPFRSGNYEHVHAPRTVPRRGLALRKFDHAYRDIIMARNSAIALGCHGIRRAIFIHDPPASGQDYIASRLIAALSGEVLIPHAVVVKQQDHPRIRRCCARSDRPSRRNTRWLMAQDLDARSRCANAPLIIVGGELTEDMLDVHYNRRRPNLVPRCK